jgi:DNA-binding response OmpR family regulator
MTPLTLQHKERAKYLDQIDYLKAEVDYWKKLVESFVNPTLDIPLSINEDAHFTNRETQILCCLISRIGKLVPHEAIVQAIYGLEDNQPADDIIKVFICKLRKKLKHHEIKADFGKGYILLKREN